MLSRRAGECALRRLSEYFDLIADVIVRYAGRVVHYAGDAVLADSPTASEALTCAAAIQRDLEEHTDREATLPAPSTFAKPTRKFPHRTAARNSTFAYKGEPMTIQRVAEELGVRYGTQH